MPTTFGTSTWPVPFETWIVTVSPSAACAPAAGFCETTVPGSRSEKTSSVSTSKPALTSRSRASASPRPTAFGTAVVPVPLETRIVTVDPSSTSAPAVGLCAKTRPSGWSLSSVTTSEPRFASSSRAIASSTVRPSSAGHRRLRARALDEVPDGDARGEQEEQDPQDERDGRARGAPALLLADRVRLDRAVLAAPDRLPLVDDLLLDLGAARRQRGGGVARGASTRSYVASSGVTQRSGSRRISVSSSSRAIVAPSCRPAPYPGYRSRTNPIRSYIASSVGSEAAVAFAAPTARRRRSSGSSARSSRYRSRTGSTTATTASPTSVFRSP